MLNKVDYDFYNQNYGGSSIPKTSFLINSNKALSLVNFLSSNKIKKELEDIKFAVCEIAELYYKQETLKTKILSEERIKSSETVGPHSVSYESNKKYYEEELLSEEEFTKEAYSICNRRFGYTGYLFRGV